MKEKRYLIAGTEEQDEKAAYQQIVREIRIAKAFGDYVVRGFQSREETYRYFDTIDRKLAPNEVEVFIGPNLLSHPSGGKYALIIKFPKEKEERERKVSMFPFPDDFSIDYVDPNNLDSWQPLRKAMAYSIKRPLTEIARLNIKANYFDLERQKEPKVQVVLSAVEAISPFLRKDFYQADIGQLACGETADLEFIDTYLQRNYPGTLRPSPYDAWTKAQRLFRGENLIQPSPEGEEDSGEEKE